MTRILVADDARDIREVLVDILSDAGYEVVEAKDGGEAFEIARDSRFDLILLDVSMPVMDGFEVWRKIRETPTIKATPVIMVTVMPAIKGERPAWTLNSRHYITKPFDPEFVELTVRVALREAQTEVIDGHVSVTGEGSTDDQMGYDDPERQRVIRTGCQPLDQILSGGLPLGSLTLIEGPPSSGKSVVCQHITYESLLDDRGVTYFTPDGTAKDLATQMESIGLDVMDYLRPGLLRVCPLEETTLGQDPDCAFSLENLMVLVAQEMERFTSQDRVIIVDAITDLVTNSEDRALVRFFSSCKRLCNEGRTIILTAQPHAFDEKMLIRLRHLCDAHLSLRVEKLGVKLGTMLTVRKAHNSELNSGNTVGFEVQRGVGIQTLGAVKVKV